MEFKNIIYTKDKDKKTAKIAINRPEVRNALNQAARREIRIAMEDVKKDENVRVLIITGAGDKAFMSGMDISELAKMNPVDIEEFVSLPEVANWPWLVIFGLPPRGPNSDFRRLMWASFQEGVRRRDCPG
jgi:enoyl-CoA hydratase/carnithine racemase